MGTEFLILLQDAFEIDLKIETLQDTWKTWSFRSVFSVFGPSVSVVVLNLCVWGEEEEGARQKAVTEVAHEEHAKCELGDIRLKAQSS